MPTAVMAPEVLSRDTESTETKGKTMRRKVSRWSLGVPVGLLIFVGLAASVSYFSREPANLGFLDYPTTVALHVVLGAVYLALAPWQFVERIRSRHLDYHRRTGRVLVVTGMVVGMTALFIGVVIPFSGWSEGVLIALFGSLFIVCLCKGFVHIRTGRVSSHREWMIRAFTVALAIATQRVIFIPGLLLMGDPTHEQVVRLSVAAWAAALVLHSAAAEVWIRHTRGQRILSHRDGTRTGGGRHVTAAGSATMTLRRPDRLESHGVPLAPTRTSPGSDFTPAADPRQPRRSR
jgi:uncharacterized membrane protein